MTDARSAARPRGPADRPTSPHLQIWRWHVTMAASILHRVTGVGLYCGALILAAWAVCLALGPGPYGAFRNLAGSLIGQIVLFLLTVSLFYHLANGIRHLWFDIGHGFEPKTADRTGAAAIAFGVVAAIAIWLVALMGGGAG